MEFSFQLYDYVRVTGINERPEGILFEFIRILALQVKYLSLLLSNNRYKTLNHLSILFQLVIKR